ncbi:MAG TPA: Bax inhibitor-1/YccA family protein [Saprospiraceae bacterium]|nr:Bax inhibitor-1/YccA family protein [Saprospiraceae bacterium]
MAGKSFYESRNPMINEESIAKISARDGYLSGEAMSIDGAINKTLILFSILVITSFISYIMPSTLLMITGAIGGLIAVLVASFKPHTSPIAAPVYTAFEGLFVGSISAVYAAQTQGIVFNAISLTFGTLLLMVILYKYKIITVTEKFRSGIIIATGAIALVYLLGFIFQLFGYNIPYIHQGGLMGIGFSLLVIGIAALNLLLDFDNFDKAEKYGAPKYMEWFCAMGLMVTLVWLYIEFLRLLSKLNRD